MNKGIPFTSAYLIVRLANQVTVEHFTGNTQRPGEMQAKEMIPSSLNGALFWTNYRLAKIKFIL